MRFSSSPKAYKCRSLALLVHTRSRYDCVIALACKTTKSTNRGVQPEPTVYDWPSLTDTVGNATGSRTPGNCHLLYSADKKRHATKLVEKKHA